MDIKFIGSPDMYVLDIDSNINLISGNSNISDETDDIIVWIVDGSDSKQLITNCSDRNCILFISINL